MRLATSISSTTVPSDEIKNLLGVRDDCYLIDNLGTYYISFNVKSPLFDG